MLDALDAKRARMTQRDRIKAAMDIFSKLLSLGVKERVRARKLLEETYRSRALQPLRGKAWPPDIWDKEMATLYVIGKYALMLDEEAPELFHKVFSYEEMVDDIISVVLERNRDDARRVILFMLGGNIDDNTIARILRVESTKLLLGFSSEDRMINLLKKMHEAFPEHGHAIRKYARYFIALRVAQAIASGIVRDRISKEALKQALAARLGFERVIPDDKYIEFIALNVFNVDKKKLQKLLGADKGAKWEEGQPRVQRP